MLTRQTGYLTIRAEPAPPASVRLEAEGWAVLPGVFSPAEVAELRRDIDRVFAETAPDKRQTRIDDDAHWAPFRYEMLNRSALCQSAIGHAAILATVEPLLGEDCHVIANTAWRQGPEESRHGGTRWHLDAGPHIPRPPGVPWPDDIPYPIFAIAAHLFLADCPIEAGPTGVIPRSHRSGQAPPRDGDVDLTCNGVGVVAVEAQAGDVALFVSDIWHRRLPALADNPGRYFLQCHYGRRDLAQRLRPTTVANQLSPEALDRAGDGRSATLVGLHRALFYDG